MSQITNLFNDWLSVQNKKKINEVKVLLQPDGTKKSSRYNQLIEKMGYDGEKLDKLFNENKDQYGKSIVEQKSRLLEELIHSMGGNSSLNKKDATIMTTIGQSYYPIADRSNAMENVIDTNDKDVLLHIRNAIVGGNFMIAEQLLKNAWGSLSLKERNGLIEWVTNMNKYNSNGHTSRPPKFKPMQKLGDMKKDDFINAFITTAKENMKIS